MSDCIFCHILAGEIPSTRLYEDDRVVAFLDVNPMAPGHALVVPRRHWTDLASVPAGAAASAEDLETRAALFEAVRLLSAAAVRAFGGGANLLQCTGVEGGQTVPHLHFHVIPRAPGGPVPPAFESGAARYASDAERDAVAARFRAAIEALRAEGR